MCKSALCLLYRYSFRGVLSLTVITGAADSPQMAMASRRRAGPGRTLGRLGGLTGDLGSGPGSFDRRWHTFFPFKQYIYIHSLQHDSVAYFRMHYRLTVNMRMPARFFSAVSAPPNRLFCDDDVDQSPESVLAEATL